MLAHLRVLDDVKLGRLALGPALFLLRHDDDRRVAAVVVKHLPLLLTSLSRRRHICEFVFKLNVELLELLCAELGQQRITWWWWRIT